jgi:hypothetical protein
MAELRDFTQYFVAGTGDTNLDLPGLGRLRLSPADILPVPSSDLVVSPGGELP